MKWSTEIALIILGLAIGFIIAFVWGAGSQSPNLPVGLLLVIAGVIVGYVIEWRVDESIRKNRDLERQLEDQQRGLPVYVEGNVIERPAGDSPVLAEVLRQLHELRSTRPVGTVTGGAAATAAAQQQESAARVEVLRRHNHELHQLGEKVAAKDKEVDALRQTFDAYRKSHPDELTNIKGIGPVYQRKLRDIGFNAYSDLAAADPAQLRRMLDIKQWQRVDIDSWIQQAKDWAEHS